MNPKVSVCLTAYEREKLIGGTIESILAQDMPDFELLIQDDASRDGTEEVCRRYEAMDDRVRYVRNAKNLAMPGNLNALLARATAPLIANLHDGDLFRPHLLSTWMEAVEREEAGFVFNALESIDSGGTHLAFHRHEFRNRIERGELVKYMLDRFDSPVWGTVMARRAAYQEVGPFRERYSFIADVEMWMRLNLKYPVAYVPEPLIRLTPHESDRPYAYVNWGLERAHMGMREEIADAYFAGDPVAAATYCRKLRRRRDRRWIRFAASCLKHRREDLYRQAMALFHQEDSWRLNAASLIGSVALPLARLWGAR
jgi:glycosyltransferase involved in cell wall biosynthesis